MTPEIIPLSFVLTIIIKCWEEWGRAEGEQIVPQCFHVYVLLLILCLCWNITQLIDLCGEEAKGEYIYEHQADLSERDFEF